MISDFNIIRRASIDPISLIYGSPAVRGLAFGIHSTKHREAVLASGTNYIGFSLQQMSATGPGLREAVFMIGGSDTGLQNAVKQGYNVAVEDVAEVEFKKDDYYVAGTDDGALTVDTKSGEKLTFKDGKFKVAATGENAFFEVLWSPAYSERSAPKTAVKVATAGALPNGTVAHGTAAHTLTSATNAALVIDGVTLAVNDRVLVAHGEVTSGTTPSASEQNGIYTVTTKGTAGSAKWVLTRDTAVDAADDFTVGDTYFVSKGTANGNTLWRLKTAPAAVETNDVEFEKVTIDSQLTFRARRLHGYVK